jgi:hypothetical protein
MAEGWFCTRQGTESGPYTPAQLKQLADAGQLQPGDEVWKGGMTKRVPARAVKGLFAAAGQPPTRSPSATAAPAKQEEELVELIAAEPEPMPQPYARPAYGQPPVSFAAPAAPAGPMQAEVVEDEPEPIGGEPAPRRRKRRKRVGPGLGLWLGIGGGAIALLVLVLVLIFTLGGGSKVTRENFKKLTPGMTEAQAIEILGTPDKKWDEGGTHYMRWESSTDVIEMNFRNGGATGAHFVPRKGGGGRRP